MVSISENYSFLSPYADMAGVGPGSGFFGADCARVFSLFVTLTELTF